MIKSPIQVTKGTKEKDGGCNFCTHEHRVVYIVNSTDPDRTLSVRFCARCIRFMSTKAKYL